MSNIFAKVDRISTGTKLFTVAIGFLIMLAYSLENHPAVQQTSQTSPDPAPPPAVTPAPAALAPGTKDSVEPAAPDASAVSPAATPLTESAVPAVAAPNVPTSERALETESRMTPASPDSPPGYFTVGSTKDDVLRAQGLTKVMGEYEWTYGLSSVQFQNGRVVSWDISPLSPLNAVLIPHNRRDAASARARGFFAVGSTRDQVIAVQGTPSHFSDTYWTYGLSSVQFRGDTVVSWHNSPVFPLRAALLPAVPADSAAAKNRGFFTVGSTKDEVLGVQGAPSNFSDTRWVYGSSWVSFQNGMVTAWNSLKLNPLKAALIPENADNMTSARARGYFVVGSTKDEVLGVQGTPTSFSATYWWYGPSWVSFQNDRVSNWNSSPLNPLRTQEIP